MKSNKENGKFLTKEEIERILNQFKTLAPHKINKMLNNEFDEIVLNANLDIILNDKNDKFDNTDIKQLASKIELIFPNSSVTNVLTVERLIKACEHKSFVEVKALMNNDGIKPSGTICPGLFSFKMNKNWSVEEKLMVVEYINQSKFLWATQIDGMPGTKYKETIINREEIITEEIIDQKYICDFEKICNIGSFKEAQNMMKNNIGHPSVEDAIIQVNFLFNPVWSTEQKLTAAKFIDENYPGSTVFTCSPKKYIQQNEKQLHNLEVENESKVTINQFEEALKKGSFELAKKFINQQEDILKGGMILEHFVTPPKGMTFTLSSKFIANEQEFLEENIKNIFAEPKICIESNIENFAEPKICIESNIENNSYDPILEEYIKSLFLAGENNNTTDDNN